MNAQQFRKKPVVIEAIRYDGANATYIIGWAGRMGTTIGQHHDGDPGKGWHLVIPTLEGEMRADIGDWIIRGVKDEFYPCKPDIFDATYEPVES